MDVSVIIPAKAAQDTIGDQLNALANQKATRSWEILVIADKTDEPTLQTVQNYRPKMPNLKLITDHETKGAGHARNIGAEVAQGRYLLFCDADDVVEKGWIEYLVNGLSTYDAVGGPLEESTLNSKESQILRRPLVTDHLHRVMGFPRAVSSNCGVRARVFNELKGFNPAYLHSEDTEFFIRLQVNGYSLGFIPEAVVHYRHGDDVRTSLKKIYRWNFTRPRLYRDYRNNGAVKSKFWVRKWMGILLGSWRLFAGKQQRLYWLSNAVRSYGKLMGSIRYRTIFL